VQGAWLKPGTHVNTIGAPRPTSRKLEDESVTGSAL
jgi:ornithine cyclodeaminase/alanine dehydrogenase-like protein (mu-crystallin family)